MPLRLDNAIALPTCPQQPQKKKTGRSRDSRLTTRLDRCQRTSRPERLAAGRDQIGKVGDIVSESTGDFISVRLGDFVGIRRYCEVVQRDQRLWLHSARRRREGRLCPHFSGGEGWLQWF